MCDFYFYYLFTLLFTFWLHCTACEILVHRPAIESKPPTLEMWSSKHWTATDVLDFYFTESLGDFPWREGEPEWFRNELRKRFPDSYKSYKVGSIFSKQVKLEQLPTSALHFNGKPASSRFRTEEPSEYDVLKEHLFPLQFFLLAVSSFHI